MKSYVAIFFAVFSISIFGQQNVDTVKIINSGTLNMEIDSSIYSLLKYREDATCAYNLPPKSDIDKNKIGRANDPCYGNTQINGFKIQIYYSKNRNEANKVKDDFSALHPELSAQVTYFTPDYRVLVGDYISKNSAISDIKRLKSQYNNAFSIPFKILCRKAK